MSYSIKVIKGCRDHNLTSGQTFVLDLIEHPIFGVCLLGYVAGQQIARLKMSGNRSKAPSLKIGDRFSAHNGDPTRKVTFEVLACNLCVA